MEIRVQATSVGGHSEATRDPGFGRLFGDHVLLAEYQNGGWQNALIQPHDSLWLAPTTAALHYGQSVFEGLKAHRNPSGGVRLFRLQDHFLRMNRSADRMCMPEIPPELFLDGIRQLVKIEESWVPRQPDQALYIRPILFATDETLGVKVSERYTFAVITSPVGSYHAERLGLWLSRQNVRSHAHGTGDIKTAGNYGACLRATREARGRGFDEVIWVDAHDHSRLEECGTMNIFFLIEGTVVTPPLSGTILPGITRDSVISILSRWGVPVEEREITVNELLDRHTSGELEECFGTGTAAGVVAVERIGYEDGCTLRLELDPPSLAERLRAALHEARLGNGPAEWAEPV